MVTYDQYFTDILTQILNSYDVLSELQDKPGDLKVINKEVLKTAALFQVIVNKVEASKNPRPTHTELAGISNKYLETYSFDREIAIMEPLYSEDTNRIHNIRFKVLESFNDKKLISKIKYILEEELS